MTARAADAPHTMPRPQTTTMKHPKSKRSYVPAPSPRTDALDDAPPMRRRRGAFYVLLMVFAVWIVALLVMYFTTVRTHGGRLAPLPTTGDLR